MERGSKSLLVIGGANLILMLGAFALLYRSNVFTEEPKPDPQRFLFNASALEARGLFKEAVQELQRCRETGALTRQKEADVLYKMARIEDDELHDCVKALPYYTMATAMNEGADWAKEAGKRTVVCMDKTGKKQQAQALLNQLTGGGEAAPEKQEGTPAQTGPVVAVIDGRSVTWDEVGQAMPAPAGKDEKDDVERRKQAVRQYLFTCMLAQEAERSGLDSQPETKAMVEQAKKEALAAAYLKKHLPEGHDQESIKKLSEQLFKLHEVRIYDANVPAP